jgi:integrase
MHDYELCTVNGLFHVKWYDGTGKRRRRSLGTTDSTRAALALETFKTQTAVAETGKPSAEIFEAYIKDRVAEGKPAAQRIRDAWKRLEPTFGKVQPQAITEEMCKRYATRRRGDGVSDGTIHVELGYLRSAMRFAFKKRKWITAEPYIPMPRKPEPLDHHLTKDEARLLIASAVKSHVKLFIIVALATAARTNAILDLTWDRVDFERKKIVLRNPEKRETSKGRALVPMNDMACDALATMKRSAISEYVIEWGGTRVASIKKGIAAAARRAGLTCTPHVLRHTAAVWMAEAGVPMEEIASYLGHRNINTTRGVYATFSPEYLRKAGEALNL